MVSEIRLSALRISELGKDLMGVEVGVDKGRNAISLYCVVRPKVLYVVDPWSNYIDPDSLEVIGEAQYRMTLDLIKRFPDIQIMRADSVTAARSFKLESLDFVYIDGGHAFEYVSADIAAWYPRVKKGGFIGGHDYDRTLPGVVSAVNSFVKANNIKNLKTVDGEWWVIK